MPGCDFSVVLFLLFDSVSQCFQSNLEFFLLFLLKSIALSPSFLFKHSNYSYVKTFDIALLSFEALFILLLSLFSFPFRLVISMDLLVY